MTTILESNLETQVAAALAAPLSTTGEILEALRRTIDLRDELSQLDGELGKFRTGLEKRLLDQHEKDGVDSLSGGGISVSFDPDAMRAKYDPDCWDELVKWAVETGNCHLIQRRITDSRVLDLVKEGVPLPTGLGLEQYIKISVRRK